MVTVGVVVTGGGACALPSFFVQGLCMTLLYRFYNIFARTVGRKMRAKFPRGLWSFVSGDGRAIHILRFGKVE